MFQAAGYSEAAVRAMEDASRLAGLPPGTIRQLDKQRSFHLMTRGDFARALVVMREQLDAVPAEGVGGCRSASERGRHPRISCWHHQQGG
jgi:hypothetical protein